MQGKRMVRQLSDRWLAGVASGVAAYFKVDPMLVRLGFIVLSLFNGIGVLLYLVLWLLLPNEDAIVIDMPTQVRENLQEMQHAVGPFIARVRDALNELATYLNTTIRRP